MQVKPEALAEHLGRGLAPVYLFCGEEPLQKEECADLLRKHCRQQDVTGREVFHIDIANFDWSQVMQEACSLSLFAERKLLEIRINTAGPGKNGSSAIRELVEKSNPDTITLLVCGKLDRASQKAAWYKAIDQAGVIVTAWPITGKHLQNWIRQRLRQAGVDADAGASDLIAARVEGNLLAAKQEIERLALLTGDRRLDAEEAARLVADSARYNVFELAERCLAGRTEDALRVLDVLRGEGTSAAVALWSLAREIRQLNTLCEAASFDQTLRSLHIPSARRNLYQAALSRIPHQRTLRLLRQSARVDQTIKGLNEGREWDELARLVIGLAGSPKRSAGQPTSR